MAVSRVPSLQFGARVLLRTDSVPLNLAIPIVKHQKSYSVRPTVAEAKANPWTESAKIRNRRNRKKVFVFPPFCPRLMFQIVFELSSESFLRVIMCRTCLLMYGIILFGQFTGTPTIPRLSVFCSDKQLYAMLVDDQNKKCLFYGSTLQKSIRGDPPCGTIEAARRVGEELIKACMDLNINEISSYDLNGFARGERMEAFEIAISRHGFLPR
ncbi:hypothetical protein CRG98_004138 [Punica granatum]|uniref:50S ribosomal protein L18, chloroplastic n=1 Tax=Punica granatum TaxID=22663 RepID=A0A2I0L444_PUNGR|nr:hypothetical protein CRG98_004138 [Punica granatum]